MSEKNQKKNILVLSYFTNEDGMACSHHIDDRLPVFRKMGYEPVLLSSICVPKHKDFVHYRVPSLSPSGLRFELRQFFLGKGRDAFLWKMRNILLFPLLPLYALERLFVKVDTTWSWQPLALQQGRKICRSGEIELIYSTGGPAVVHSVASCLAREFSLQWLAEVQDPLIHGYCAKNESEHHLLEKVEKKTYEQADRMIFLTNEALKATEKRVGKTGRGVVIYPGAAAGSITKSETSGNSIRMAHFGSLGGVRNLEKLLEGLELSCNSEPAIKSGIHIDLFGNVGGDDMNRIEASSLKNIFSIKGLVPRSESLEVMQSYDVLLLVQGVHDISRETIPSKVYEYLQSGRQVLGLIYKNDELWEMLENLGHIPVKAESGDDIARALAGLYNRWQREDYQSPRPAPYIIERAVRELLSD